MSEIEVTEEHRNKNGRIRAPKSNSIPRSRMQRAGTMDWGSITGLKWRSEIDLGAEMENGNPRTRLWGFLEKGENDGEREGKREKEGVLSCAFVSLALYLWIKMTELPFFI